MEKINIYNFLDPVSYLEACFNLKKTTNEKASLRKWAIELGIKSSDVLFKIFSRNKQISPNLASELAIGLKLDSTETTYFECMVKYSQSTTVKDRNLYQLVMNELRGVTGKTTYIEDDDIFGHWANLAVLSFCNLAGGCTRDKIHGLFIDNVPEEIITNAIQRLLRLKLLVENEKGILKRINQHETTRNDTSKESVYKYYEEVFDLAKARIHYPADEREFQCSLMAIKRDQLPMFKSMIRHFKAKLGEMSPTEQGDQVYHLSIQFFPVSKKLDSQSINSSEQSEAWN